MKDTIEGFVAMAAGIGLLLFLCGGLTWFITIIIAAWRG